MADKLAPSAMCQPLLSPWIWIYGLPFGGWRRAHRRGNCGAWCTRL